MRCGMSEEERETCKTRTLVSPRNFKSHVLLSLRRIAFVLFSRSSLSPRNRRTIVYSVAAAGAAVASDSRLLAPMPGPARKLVSSVVAGSAARKFRRVVQVNTQRRSNPWCEKIREKYIRSGKLAPLLEGGTWNERFARKIVPALRRRTIRKRGGWCRFPSGGRNLTGIGPRPSSAMEACQRHATTFHNAPGQNLAVAKSRPAIPLTDVSGAPSPRISR